MPVSGSPKEIVHEELHRFKHGQLHSEELAYIAGLFDGEGSVNFGNARSTKFIRIFVTNTNLEILEWLKSIFGGDIKPLSSRKSGWKKGYCWRLQWSRAVEFLSSIEPWSKIKRPQIVVAITWDVVRPHRGGKPPCDHKEVMDFLSEELRWLNKRGVSSEPKPSSLVLKEMGLCQQLDCLLMKRCIRKCTNLNTETCILEQV